MTIATKSPPRLVMLAGIALGVVLAMAASCDKRAPKAAPDGAAQSVTLAPVERRPVDRFLEVTGTLYGQEEVTVAAEVPGRIVSISADLGDIVEHGGPLAQIDETDYRLAVEEQRASVQASLAKLGLSVLPEGEVDLATLPPVARALAEASNAQSKLERARLLFDREPPLLSAQDFSDIQTRFEVATTTVGVERLNAQALLADARAKSSTLQVAMARLADTRIVAPREQELRYRVAARRVSVGEVVADGQPLFRLVASEQLKFRGMVPERFAGDVRVGARAMIHVDSRTTEFAATVARVSPAIDVATRSFEIELSVPNPEGLLQPGGFARASVFVRTDQQTVFVPDSAVLQFAGVQRVFSVADGKAVEHRVVAATAHVGSWGEGASKEKAKGREIISGLSGVERVVLEPRGLTNGTPVRVEPPTTGQSKEKP